jgi:hypothetical protein
MKFGSIIVDCKVQHLGKTYDECKKLAPKDKRLLTLNEVGLVANNEEFLKATKFKDSKHDFWFEQPFPRVNNSGAWLGCNIGNFYVYVNNNLIYNKAVRGVIYCKDVKKVRE